MQETFTNKSRSSSLSDSVGKQIHNVTKHLCSTRKLPNIPQLDTQNSIEHVQRKNLSKAIAIDPRLTMSHITYNDKK